MKRLYLIAAMCLLGTLLLPKITSAQEVFSSSGDKPTWASSSFKRTLPNTYLEVVVVTGHDQKSIIKDAEKEIVRRRKLTVGESDPWIKSGYIASYWETTAGGLTGYFLYQTRKNPTYDAEAVEATTEYGFSPRVFIPGAQQIWKGQNGKGSAFIAAEVACVGGIVAAEGLRTSYENKIASTHNASQRQTYTDNANNCANVRNIMIGAAAAVYVWNIIDGIISPGRPTIKYNDKILTFTPYATGETMGLALNIKF